MPRYDEILAKVQPFLKASGYAKSDYTILPISGFTGANLKDPAPPGACPWYTYVQGGEGGEDGWWVARTAR